MPRSLRVQQTYINQVKLSLSRNGFPSQRSLAEDVGFALATVSNFVTGKPVDYTTFEELCRKLGLNWKEISTMDVEVVAQTTAKHLEPSEKITFRENLAIDDDLDTLPRYPNGAVPIGSTFYLERTPLEAQIDQELRKPGALVRIKAPREMGKTSLLLRVLDSAKSLGYKTVILTSRKLTKQF
jgi:DNA-binding Xre family transcriptional regulator